MLTVFIALLGKVSIVPLCSWFEPKTEEDEEAAERTRQMIVSVRSVKLLPTSFGLALKS
jgi:hypothetical protein